MSASGDVRRANLSGAILGGALGGGELATALAASLAHVAVSSFASTHGVAGSGDGGVESLVLRVVGGMRGGAGGDLLGRWRRLASASGDEVLS